MGSSSMAMSSMAAQTSMQQLQENQLLQNLQAERVPTQESKIQKGARQFEAMLLSSWLQQAEQSFATVPGADDDDDAAGRDQMMSLGVQTLSESLAASGGIGIGSMIARAMEKTAEAQKTVQSTAPEMK